ncbi:transferase [Nostoc linckia z18]|jgi:galactoside O-acetyltransferase|uniref:Transferase n=3 Tax=Nostoc TaxID=1177 RepID=A0A9Q5ZDJ9_NOSLI|nr:MULTISPECIES: acyltransferase [Nostoc]MBL1203085.1 acyltransferase [Nostoc sp. GBBB01]MDZ8011682.1 DapH/DapD/GlmU-related protein [Nostoc sp. ZfuVER08]PHK36110.1 transferase [Nostoc linckia z15]PHK43288.1 transferase [Nostoc linckia z16]MBC1237775.1 acyltransferase [Nostoc sp. 2RC]
MYKDQYFSKLQRAQELLVTTIFGDLPTLLFGSKLRNLVYRSIFAKIGSPVYIQNGVELNSAYCIEIGNGVYIFKGVRLDASGHKNNRIYLANRVAIERYVDIGCLENTYIHIDEDTFIGPNVCIEGPGDIKIGKHCMIAAHSGIYANNHNFADPMRPIKSQGVTRKGIVIEDDCWLGHKVTVLDGVTIGQGSVIGAGAVVNKDIPPFSVAVGIPARVIKNRIGKELAIVQDKSGC